MRSNKRYTNETFTKRVDHEAGRHRPARSIPEPAVCEVCGDVYTDRRWVKPGQESGGEKHTHFRPATVVVCPGCERERSGTPSGYLHLEGSFLTQHQPEIERLLKNEAERAAEDNPLGRIMGWEPGEKGGLTVTTTTEHLAQRLGHAIEKAFDGKVRYDFSHENKLAHVWWERD